MKELEVTIKCTIKTDEEPNDIDMNLYPFMEQFQDHFDNTIVKDIDINVEDPSWYDDEE